MFWTLSLLWAAVGGNAPLCPSTHLSIPDIPFPSPHFGLHGGLGNGRVVFLDTEGSFRPERLRPIAKRFEVPEESVMENIKSVLCSSRNQLPHTTPCARRRDLLTPPNRGDRHVCSLATTSRKASRT